MLPAPSPLSQNSLYEMIGCPASGSINESAHVMFIEVLGPQLHFRGALIGCTDTGPYTMVGPNPLSMDTSPAPTAFIVVPLTTMVSFCVSPNVSFVNMVVSIVQLVWWEVPHS